MRPDRTQTWVSGPVRTIKASSADSVWCKCDLVHSHCLLRRWWMQFSHCFWKPLAERIAAQVEIISFCCNEGNLQKTTAPTHAEAIGRSCASHLVAETTSWHIFFFLQLSCWLLLTCFYWQNDFFFFLECQFHDTIILLPNPVIKRIKSIIYWFLERIGLLCLIYLFTLIWYRNPISATSKYNLPSNLENVVIFLNIAQVPQFWSCLDVAHKTARKDLILPIETIAEALGSFFFSGAETAVR